MHTIESLKPLFNRCRHLRWLRPGLLLALLCPAVSAVLAQGYDAAPDNMRQVLFGDRLVRGGVIGEAALNTTSGQGLYAGMRPGVALSKHITLHAVFEHLNSAEQDAQNAFGAGLRFWAPVTAGFLQTSLGFEVSRIGGEVNLLAISVPAAVNVWLSPRIGLNIEFFRFNILNSITEGTARSGVNLDLKLINPRLGLIFIAGGNRPN